LQRSELWRLIFEATGFLILPLHKKHGPSLMFAWPSARYFRGAIVDASTIIDVCDSISLSPCWRDTAIGQKVRDTQSSCMNRMHLTHHLFLYFPPQYHLAFGYTPESIHRDIQTTYRRILELNLQSTLSHPKDCLSLICRSGMLSGSALQMHMHACRQRRDST
jgi:hypothetical protein